MRTRFAPSPTGPLHLGHAYSAMLAHGMAREAGGTFLLRIEDLDRSRSRPEWDTLIREDLAWLGLAWPEPVLRQSDRLPAYRAALEALWARGLLYPCSCHRRDIMEAASAPQEGSTPTYGPDGLVYPGTCRGKPRSGPLPEDLPLRLDMRKAAEWVGTALFEEDGAGPEGQTGSILTSLGTLVHGIGDVVLARRGMGSSYHLSVVLDDAEQGVTHVVRGQDLFDATAIHVVIQALLDLPTPRYHHHALIRDAEGRRLAKRDDARAIATYRAEGLSPDDIRAMIAAQIPGFA